MNSRILNSDDQSANRMKSVSRFRELNPNPAEPDPKLIAYYTDLARRKPELCVQTIPFGWMPIWTREDVTKEEAIKRYAEQMVRDHPETAVFYVIRELTRIAANSNLI